MHQLRKENEELERKKQHQQKERREMLLKAVRDKKKHLDAEKKLQLAEEKKILEKDFQDSDRENVEIIKKKVRSFILKLWGNTSSRLVLWPCELHRVRENGHKPFSLNEIILLLNSLLPLLLPVRCTSAEAH